MHTDGQSREEGDTHNGDGAQDEDSADKDEPYGNTRSTAYPG